MASFARKKGDDPTRFYENKFADFDSTEPNDVNKETKMLNQQFTDKIKDAITQQQNDLEEQLDIDGEKSNFSVYVGIAGIAYLYLHLAEKLKNPSLLTKAHDIVEKALPCLRRSRISFLEGDPGPLAVGAVLCHKLQNQNRSKELLKRLEDLHEGVVSSKSHSDELLYGRVGYLYGLMFVQKYIGKNAVNCEIVKKVVDATIKSGQNLAKKEKSRSTLKYRWYDKNYTGAAHGITGILYMLMQARDYLSETQLNGIILPCLQGLLETRFKSGNWPSTEDSSSGDKLVQWCHGAPGVVYCYILAFEIFKNRDFYDAAIDAGEVIWYRGILQKGYGLCHGVSGNGYAFLALFQFTKDLKYLHRAAKFAEWCINYGTKRSREPDRPLSLFEGLAGNIYFLGDMLDPVNAKFPGFTL